MGGHRPNNGGILIECADRETKPMPTTITPRITAAGIAASIAAHGAGLSLQITHVAIGAGSYAPSGSETALSDMREFVTVASGAVGAGGSFSLSAMFGENSGVAYDAKEVGFFAGSPASGGVLFAVHSGTETIVHRSTLDFLARFSLVLTSVPTGSVSILVDPTASVSHALIQDHLDDSDPHPQYTTHAEAVQIARQPAGVTFFFAGTTPPPYSLKCNGASVSRTTYAALFAAIGTTYGALSDSTFNLPDIRGEFIRGFDDGRGVDSGRTIGSWQGSQNLSHNHSIYDPGHSHQQKRNDDVGSSGGSSNPDATYGSAEYGATSSSTTGISLGDSGGNESRPRNIALLACIYF